MASGSRGFPGGDDFQVSCWLHCYSLLGESEEQFASASRPAPVETKGEFIQVVLEMLCAYRSLMRAQ